MTDTQTLTTFTVKLSNEYFWAEYHINALSEEAARDKARALATEGELADAAEEEYKMGDDDIYDDEPDDYRYEIYLVEPADDYDQRADDGPHMVMSGGNG